MVIDEWMTYAPLVDGWQRTFDRPLIGPLAETFTGIPTGVDLAEAAEWIFVSAYVRERAVAGLRGGSSDSRSRLQRRRGLAALPGVESPRGLPHVRCGRLVRERVGCPLRGDEPGDGRDDRDGP